MAGLISAYFLDQRQLPPDHEIDGHHEMLAKLICTVGNHGILVAKRTNISLLNMLIKI